MMTRRLGKVESHFICKLAIGLFQISVLLILGMAIIEVTVEADHFFLLLLFAVCTPHAEYYILFWRGVRGCLNNFSGCYCKIWKL